MSELLNPNNLYFFDTNAIYYYCGTEAPKYNLQEFRNDIEKMPYKIMPSCVFQEIIVKYRNNLDFLGKILTTLASNNFLISPSQYDDLGTHFLNKMLEDLEKSVNEQLLKKIDTESRLIYLICFAVTMIFINILEAKASIPNVEEYNESFVKGLLGKKEEEVLKEITSRLKTAYENDDTEREVKKIYNDICFEYCLMAKYYIYLAIHKDENSSDDEELKRFKNDPSTLKYMEYKKSYHEYWAYLKDEKTIQEGIEAVSIFFRGHKYTEEQIGYLKTKLEKLLLLKGKLEKNDIYDILYLFSYSDYCAQSFNAYEESKKITKKDIILLTFDKKIKEYIKTFSPLSSDIIDSYKIGK